MSIDTSGLMFPKPRPFSLDLQDKRDAKDARDEVESAKVRARSGGRCEMSLSGRCRRLASEVHHLMGGIGRRGYGSSALAKNKAPPLPTVSPPLHGRGDQVAADGDRVAVLEGAMTVQPFLKWFPGDWQSDPGVRMCSLAARGFWAECLWVMHSAEPRGYLLVNGQKPTDKQLATLASCSVSDVKRYRKELLTNGVPGVREDGVLYSRKMVRDTKRSQTARENGRHGGNPALLDNPGEPPPD